MTRVITISRQFGSGGREIGKRLANALGSSYYDRELIEMVSKESGLSSDYIEKFSESADTRHYPIAIGRSFLMPHQMPSDKIYITQTKIIQELAAKGDCVFVGRCADSILKGNNPFKIFIYSSDMDFRIKRCSQKASNDKVQSEKDLQKQIIAIDKQRSKYYEYYTGQLWSNMQNYNICIDTSSINIKNAVNMIVSAWDD